VVLTLGPGAGEGEVQFSVQDTGIGIALETRGKLFQPFSQAAGQQRGGTGLGLVICQALVGLLGGSIAVESHPGKGSVFSFSIRSAGEAKPPSSRGLVTAIPGNVLILDAHERSGRLLRGALQGLARRVEIYTSAAEFFVALGASEKVDAILIDPRVPFEQPVELLQQLATIGDELPPVLLLYPRGAPDRKQIEAIFQARFRRAGSALLAKPLMPRHLIPAVLSACLGETTERIHTGRLPRVEEHRRLRVLVAEDNPVNQRVVARMLAKLGHEVALAENGQLALEVVRKGGVDVVLLDVQMPVMDGLETAHQLVKEFPRKRRPRVIGLTANALAGDRERCLAAGMDDYLTKPLQLPELKQALGEAPHDRERTAAEVIDPHVASQLRFRFDPRQLTALLEQTSEQLSSGCAALPLAFEARDFSRVEVLAGELKERCAVVGLVRLYAVLVKIGHDAQKENIPELTRYVGRLEREAAQARKAMLRLASSRSRVLSTATESSVTDTPVLAAGRVERSGHRWP
jgi:CheY-like chemotaxis protein